MSEVLYRKYRSQTFDEVVGQAHITDILKNAVAQDKLSHAYLFVGSRGTGKTSTARILAKAVNCPHRLKDGNPCGKCKICKSVEDGSLVDLVEIDAASNRGIDQIRELKEKIEYTPVQAKYKVYIIDEVHMLTKEAFNALLKTLEEPPKHVIFILATTEIFKVPPTIQSRCQRYDFRLGTDDQIRTVLKKIIDAENFKVTNDAVDIIVENARGSYRDALSLLSVVISADHEGELDAEKVRFVLGLSDSTMVYHFLESCFRGNIDSALKMLDDIYMRGVDLQQFVGQLLMAVRQILISAISNNWQNCEYSFARNIDQDLIFKVVNVLLEAEKNLKYTDFPLLVMEMLAVKISSTLDNDLAVDSTPVKPNNDNTLEGGDTKQKRSSSKKGKESSADDKGSRDKKSAQVKATKESRRENINLKLNSIKDRWEEVIEKIKPANGHLYGFLGKASLINLEGSQIVMEVPFSFHKERIESAHSRDAINSVLKDVFGVELSYKCVVAKQDGRYKKLTPEQMFEGVNYDQFVAQNQKTSSVSGSDDKKPAKKPFRVNKKIAAAFEGL